MKTIALFFFLPLMLLRMNSAQANLVANPSFETFATPIESYGGDQFTVGSTALSGWSITSGEVVALYKINS